MADVDTFNEGFDLGLAKKHPKKKAAKEAEKIGLGGVAAIPRSYKKGGTVKRSGYARVHRGELVLTKAQAKKHFKKTGRKKVSSKG
jgi:hypothetical protein